MMDLSTAGAGDPRLARPKYRDPVIEEAEEEGQLKHYRSEEFLGHTNPAYSSLARTRPDLVKSNESLSSGYSGSTEGFLPSSADLQQAEQTERWEERLDNIVRGLRANKTRIEGGNTGI